MNIHKTIQAIFLSEQAAKPYVICSILYFTGSVPRGDYPLMLVGPDRVLGTIGGGAMEQTVINMARSLTEQSAPLVYHNDMTGDDVAQPEGVCGGRVTVLMEVLSPEICGMYSALLESENSDRRKWLFTEVRLTESTHVRRELIAPDCRLPESATGKDFLMTAAKQGKSAAVQTAEGFLRIEVPQGAPTLRIFGAGHVGRAVADAAGSLEWNIVVYDDRPEQLDGLPENVAKITVQDFESAEYPTDFQPSDYVIITTRNHHLDLVIVKKVLTSGCGYVGLMSSPRKWELISSALRKSGFTDEQLTTVRAPIGLPIGSETVPEIAVSILAQVIQEYRLKPAG